MSHSGRLHSVVALLGVFFGLVLSRIGFTEFGQVQSMFRFDDLRLTLTFATGVAIVALGLRMPRFRGRYRYRRIHPGSIAGGLCFGAGWALSGACPSIAWVQLGEGRLPALLTILGVVAGTWLYPKIHGRFFGWPTESCSS